MTPLEKPGERPATERRPQPDAPGRPAEAEAAEPEGSQAVTEAALFEAFGGVRGLVETTVPGLFFIGIYTVNQDIRTAAFTAFGLALAMGLLRLLQRGTVKHAFSGVFGVGFGVVFAMMTGNAKDFYLPGMLYTLALSLAYLITAASGFPLLGLVLGPLFKENLSWRNRNPGRKRAYVKASYAWGFILLGKCAVLFPLYLWAEVAKFGWVTMALKIPPFLLAVYLTWIFLAKAPPPINVIAEMEAEERAESEREHGGKSGRETEGVAEPGVRRSEDATDAPWDGLATEPEQPSGPRHRRR